MFCPSPAPKPQQCACGRDPKDAALTTFRSISGVYRFHHCPCGMEWTERVAPPAAPLPARDDGLLEFHQNLQAFHGRLHDLAQPSPHWRPAAG
jgi:hypothetical protein